MSTWEKDWTEFWEASKRIWRSKRHPECLWDLARPLESVISMPLSEQLVLICTPHVLDECAAEPSSWILKCSAGKSTRVSTMLDVTTTVPHVWVGNLNRFPFLPNDRFTLFFTSTANLRMMLILSPPLTGKHCHKPLAYWKSPMGKHERHERHGLFSYFLFFALHFNCWSRWSFSKRSEMILVNLRRD